MIKRVLGAIRERDCFRVQSKIVVKQTGVVVSEDAQRLVDQGLVHVDATSGRVTITAAGLAILNKSLSPITIKSARAFIERHDRFFLFGDKLTVNSGADFISVYAAQHFIEDGTLTALGDGWFTRTYTTIVVSYLELDAVRRVLHAGN